jgi:hypothetical protein
MGYRLEIRPAKNEDEQQLFELLNLFILFLELFKQILYITKKIYLLFFY